MRLTADKVVTWKNNRPQRHLSGEGVHRSRSPRAGRLSGRRRYGNKHANTRQTHELFLARKGKTSIQLVVAVTYRDTVHLFGPDPQAPSTSPHRSVGTEGMGSTQPRPQAADARALPAEHVHRRTRSAGYQITNAGLLRPSLLKRLGVQSQALYTSLTKMIESHEVFLDVLGKGYVLRGDALSEWVSSESDDLDAFVTGVRQRPANRIHRRTAHQADRRSPRRGRNRSPLPHVRR